MNDYEDAKLIADAPKLLAEVKRLRMIVAKLEDARIESASMFDRPALFDAVREIYEQRLQDIHQEKREEE
jgi:helix-turn-helix protein